MKHIYAGLLLLLVLVGFSGKGQINADFVGTPATSGCIPLNVVFTDISVPSAGANIVGTSRQWLIDGVPVGSNNSQLAYTFTSPGTFSVALIICDDSPSCDTLTRNGYINAFGRPTPVLSASPTSGCAPLTVNFVDNSLPICGGMTSTTIYPNHGGPNLNSSGSVTYNSPGNYNVRIRLVNSCGCITDTTFSNAITVDPSPSANFSSVNRSSCTSPHTVNFNNTSTGGGLNYFWDFGDGTTSTAANPSHTYTLGNYTVTLIATNPATGCADTFVRPNYVTIDSVVADFATTDTNACQGEQVCFTNTSFPPGATFSWDFGDGSPPNSAANPCHVYNTLGTYTVSLTVTSGGCSDTRTKNNYVTVNPGPSVDFSTLDDTITCLYPYTVNWQNSSTPGISYLWTFSNASPDSAFTFNPPPVTYSLPGGNATLLVTDNNGCQVSKTKPIQIQPINARFRLDENRGCAPLRIAFRSISNAFGNDSLVDFQWDFDGDGLIDRIGGSDTGSFVFNDTGCFSPTLIVNSAAGCTDTTTLINRLCVGDTPTVSFAYSLDTTCFEEIGVDFVSTSSPGDSCYWDFRDGSAILPGCDVNHIFADIGNFEPLLTACHYGCCDTLSQGPITINPPISEFVDSFTCATPLTRYFRNTSTRGTSFNWDFGDPNRTDDTANTVDAVWTYDSSGCYLVTLTVYNDTFDCTHVSTRNRCIYDPIASAKVSPSFICRGGTVNLTNTSPHSVPGNQGTTRWDFDYDGVSINYSSSPFNKYKFQTRRYFSPGVYSVVMRNITPNNCIDTVLVRDAVTVHGAYASLTTSTLSGCAPFTISATDLSYAPMTYIDTIVWDFGDGSPTSSDSIVSHIYTTPGTYTLRLTAWDSFGCQNSVTRTVTVQHPDVDFSVSDSFICENQTINFTNNSIGVGMNYQWTFPTGTPPSSTGANPSVSFQDTGVITVRLVVTDNLGCMDSAFQNIIIRNPVANFGAFATTNPDCPPVFVNFVDSSLNNVVAWNWTYDQGSVISLLQNPSHVYSRPINDTIQLVITTGSGCTDTAIRTAVRVGGPYINVVSEMIDSCIPVRVAYYVQSVRTDTIRAVFPGTSRGTELLVPSCYGSDTAPCLDTFFITYNQAGSYPIDFVIRDSAGCSRVETIPLDLVIVDTPSANFALAFNNICGGGTVNFTDNSSAGPGGFPITGWTWDFGDGNGSNLQNPTHVYTGPNIYQVSLIAENSLGCPDTSTRPLVIPVDPIARIFTLDTSACVPATIQFSDSTIADTLVAEWFWDAGFGGNTSTLSNPSFTYTAPGVYTLLLGVRDSLGCTDSTTFQVTINPNPVVDAGLDTGLCRGDSVRLLATGALNYSWRPSAGLSDTTVANPWVSPDSTTTYFVSGTDLNGCQGNDSVSVRLDHVIPFFTFDTVCLGDTTFFFDQSTSLTGSINSWTWDFDDQGAGATGPNVFHVFGGDSTYNVRLTITDNRGCIDDTVIGVPISPAPTANFGPDRSCFGDTTQFVDLSQANTGTLISWSWDFGDGTQDTVSNPTHYYQGPGSYTVCLTVANSSLCAGIDDTCQSIEITTKPRALFRADTACFGDSNQFVDNSIDLGGVGLSSWSWELDNTNPGSLPSNQQNPSIIYPSAGIFNATLTVTDSAGCSHDTTGPVMVYQNPISSFIGDTVCLGDSVCPADLSVPGDLPIVNWSWDFDTTIGQFASGQNVCFRYNSAGARTIQLAVTDGFGCTDTSFGVGRAVDVVTAIFDADTACAGDTTQFTDLSFTSFGIINSWVWDFADGDSAFVANPRHSYRTGGTYPVHLTVITDLGCLHDTTIDVKVYLLPTASFDVDSTCIGDSTFFFDASINNGDGAISIWNWDLDLANPGSIVSSLDTSSALYPGLGSYNFQLTVTDVNGCQDDTTGTTAVVGLPQARFTSDSACIRDSICIVDQSIPNAASLSSWTWQFDITDTGSFLQGQNACYEYPDSGVYVIRLTVADALGCEDDTTNTVVVSSIPLASFITDSVCLGDTTFFLNESVSDFGNLTYRLWSFGDGDTSTLFNPFHIYDTAGIYNVRLEVRNPIGCPDDTVIQVVVFDQPTADFLGDTVCFGDSTHFLDLSTNLPWGVITNWEWDIDTANPANPIINSQNPSVLYPLFGDYGVSLRVTDEHGCVGDTVKTVSFYQLPTARFNSDTICNGDTVCLNDSSLDGTGFINSYLWIMDDGDSLLGSNICHLYQDSGTYQVQLVVTDNRGCSDDTTLAVRVNNTPLAVFDFLPTCSGDSTRFFDQSLPCQGILTDWLWDFGDGTSDSVPNPVHIYQVGDTFNVSLSVTNSFGCTHDTSGIVPILQGPIMDFSFDTVCFGDTTRFVDLSTNGTGVNETWIWDFGTPAGDTAMTPNPRFVFPNDTSFNVTLTILDTNGCRGILSQDVLVFTLPEADFGTSPLCFNDEVNFFDQSIPGTNPLSGWSWDFDDNGAVSSQQNPSHSFSLPSSYDIQLVAEDSRGCLDTFIRNITVNPQPVADFEFSRPIVCVGEQLCLFDSSTASGSPGAISAWTWDFNYLSGTDDITQNPCTTYNTSGSYDIQLIVEDTSQCLDTVIRTVRVFDLPQAEFDWEIACVDSPMFFTDFSLPGDTTITGWLWDFGDMVQDIVQNPSHEYQTPGGFLVNLEVTDANGCTDDISKGVQVDFRPDVSALREQTICFGESVVLSATGASRYTWEPNVWYNPLIATGDSIISTPLNTISYTVAGFNGVCPPDDTTITITVIPTRPIDLRLNGPDSVIVGMPTYIYADISGLYDSIRWDPDSSLSCTDCIDPTATPSVNTTYTATVYYSQNGVLCTQSDTISVRVRDICPEDLLFVPTGFSPNGDGNNDVLYVRGVGIQRVNLFRIFDRWGNLMFEVTDATANDTQFSWDGTDPGGASLNPGVFVYVAEVVCSNGDVLKQTGNVTLIK